jgi:hypothetical protein
MLNEFLFNALITYIYTDLDLRHIKLFCNRFNLISLDSAFSIAKNKAGLYFQYDKIQEFA